MRALLTPLSDWAGDNDMTVIGISHFNKGGNAHTLYRVTDSGAITAVARAVWFAVRDVNSGKLMFLSGKNNLGKDVPGLSYEIEEVENTNGIKAPRIAWDMPTNITAEQALSERKDRNTDALDEAEEWLRELLSNGPVASDEVYQGASANGHTRATINRAKLTLGVRSTREGGIGKKGKWVWTIPDASEDFQTDDDFG
jgi:hypothetical protein